MPFVTRRTPWKSAHPAQKVAPAGFLADKLVSAYMVDAQLPIKDDGSGYGLANGFRSSALGQQNGKYYTLTGYYISGASEAPVVITSEGHALYFDGTNYKAGNTAHPKGWSGAVTYIARVFLNDTTSTHVIVGHFNSDQSPVYNYGAGLVVTGGNLYAAGAYGNAKSISAAAPATGKWVTVACVTNTASGRLFIDGRLVASGDLSGAYSDYPFAVGSTGQQVHGSTNNYSLNGYVKHVLTFSGDIGNAAIAELSQNMRSIYAPRTEHIYFPAGAGGSVSLTIADALHGHASDAIDLSWLAALSVNDAAHGHAADNVTLAATTGTSLAIADALHSHVADGVVLTTQWLLAVADATHGHAADAVTLVTQRLLAIADAAHGHAADNVTLDTSNATWLTTQDAAHGHAADNAALSLSTWLAIVEAAHGHTAESPTLTAHVTLAIAEALHAMTADNVVLIDPSLITLVKDLRFAVRRLRTLAASRQRNFAVNRSRHVH